MAELFDSHKIYDVEKFCNEVSETILNQSSALFTGAGTSMQYGGKSWKNLIKTNIPCNSNWSETDYAQYLVLIDENELRKKIAVDLKRFHNKCNKKKKRITKKPESRSIFSFLHNMKSWG